MEEVRKFSSFQDVCWVSNWNIIIDEERYVNNDFDKEIEMVNYIANNIDNFAKDILNDEVVSFEIDKPIDRQRFWPRWRRVDIFIQWKQWPYIIECKNAKNSTEIRFAIWQLLDYWREYLDPKKEMLLIANMYDENTAKTIAHYWLPIRYIVFTKSKSFEYGWEKKGMKAS